MSFYQPSLSLYDVLNALAAQSQRPSNADILFQEQQQQQQAQAEAYARAQVQAQAQAQAQARARARAVTGGSYPFRASDTSAGFPGYYYGMTGNPQYYRPRYYYTGEDESDEDDLDDVEGEEEKEPQYLKVPSYYHSRAPKDIYDQAEEQPVNIQDLLSSLFGLSAPAAIPKGEKQEESKPAQNTEVGGLLQNSAQDGAEGDDRKTDDVEKNDENENEEKLEEAPVDYSSRPKITTNPSKRQSFVHQPVRSPVPDPLQVSKPEKRLDLPFSPEVNVYDTPKAYVVAVALPGAHSKAFKIDYHPSSHELIIKGDLEDKLDIGEEFLKVTELKYGAFQRTVKFPVLPRIQDEEIKASYKNGILQINVPKIIDGSEKPAPKKRIVIEDIPDEELAFEENPNPVQE